MKLNLFLVTSIVLATVSAHAQWEEWGDEGPKQNGANFQNRQQISAETTHVASVKAESLSQQPVPEPLTEKDLKRDSPSPEKLNIAREVNSVDFSPKRDEATKSQRLARAEQKIAARDKHRKSSHQKPSPKVKKTAHHKTKSKMVAQHKHGKSHNIASLHSKSKAKKPHHSRSHMSQAVAAN